MAKTDRCVHLHMLDGMGIGEHEMEFALQGEAVSRKNGENNSGGFSVSASLGDLVSMALRRVAAWMRRHVGNTTRLAASGGGNNKDII